MSVPITPIKDNVLAQEPEAKATTKTGLYLPSGAQERIKVLKVVAIGPDVTNVKVGDNIIFKSYSQTDVKMDGTEYAIVAQEDIIATVKQ